MHASVWTRQTHRWLSIALTLTVVANVVFRAVAPGEPASWLTYSPLPPLLLQFVTGLYLFAQPYFAKRYNHGRAR